MRAKPYFTRLLIWSWLALFAVLAVVFWRYGDSLDADLAAETTASAMHDIDVVRWLIEERAPYADAKALEDRVAELGSRFGLRVTYIVDGKVKADSDVAYEALPTLEDHSTRPEVIQALASGSGSDVRRSVTLGRQLLYAAKRVENLTPGAGAGALRLAVPYSRVSERISQIKNDALLVLLPTALCAALMAYLLTRSMSRTMRSFSEAVRAIGEGDFESRIRVSPGPEFEPLADSINGMAKKIRRHVKTITEQCNQRAALFDGLAEGLAVVDHDGRIVDHNQALTRFLPKTPTGVGRFPLEATLSLDLQKTVNEYLVLRSRDEPTVMELDVGAIRAELRITPFDDHKGRRKLILAFHDVTQVRMAERTLREFLIQASHHLRTPLTSIKGYSETLAEKIPDDPEQLRRLLGVIDRNADAMSGVITDMLTMAGQRDLTRTTPSFGASAKAAEPSRPTGEA